MITASRCRKEQTRAERGGERGEEKQKEKMLRVVVIL